MTDTRLTTVSREVLEKVAAGYQELMLLRDAEQVTMAQMIRWCVRALTQTTDQARAQLERAARCQPGHSPRGTVPMSAPQKKVTEDRKLALLYLDMLATRMEAHAPEPRPLTGVLATLE